MEKGGKGTKILEENSFNINKYMLIILLKSMDKIAKKISNRLQFCCQIPQRMDDTLKPFEIVKGTLFRLSYSRFFGSTAKIFTK